MPKLKKPITKFVTLLFCAGFLMGLSGSHSADKILGVWELSDKTGKTKFYKNKGKYYGKVVWGKDVVKADGKTSKKDTKNPNPKHHSRDIIGITYVTSLVFEDGEYSGGYVYDPTSGKTYNCKIWFEGDDLYFRGYKGISMLGKTIVYKRIK